MQSPSTTTEAKEKANGKTSEQGDKEKACKETGRRGREMRRDEETRSSGPKWPLLFVLFFP